MNLFQSTRAEIRSMAASYRQNVAWAQKMASVDIDEHIPCAEWCHNVAALPVTEGIITKNQDRDATERALNEYRLAKYMERSIWRRQGDGNEVVLSRIPKAPTPEIAAVCQATVEAVAEALETTPANVTRFSRKKKEQAK
jgi:hypothetical protein